MTKMGTYRSTDNSSFKWQAGDDKRAVNLYRKITANESAEELEAIEASYMNQRFARLYA